MGNANVSQSAAAIPVVSSRRNPHFNDYQLTAVGPNHHVIHNGWFKFKGDLCFFVVLSVCVMSSVLGTLSGGWMSEKWSYQELITPTSFLTS